MIFEDISANISHRVLQKFQKQLWKLTLITLNAYILGWLGWVLQHFFKSILEWYLKYILLIQAIEFQNTFLNLWNLCHSCPERVYIKGGINGTNFVISRNYFRMIFGGISSKNVASINRLYWTDYIVAVRDSFELDRKIFDQWSGEDRRAPHWGDDEATSRARSPSQAGHQQTPGGDTGREETQN